MDIFDAFRVVARWWYVTLPLVLLSLLAAFLLTSGLDPEYTAEGTVLLVGPSVREIETVSGTELTPVNPLIEQPSALEAAAVVSALSAETPQVRDLIAEEGLSIDYSVFAQERSPIVLVQARASSKEVATATAVRLVDVIDEEIRIRQEAADAPQDQRVTTSVIGLSAIGGADFGGRNRARLALVFLGLGASFGAAFLADALTARRTRAGDFDDDGYEPLTTEPAPSRRTGSGDYDDDVGYEPLTTEPAPSRRTGSGDFDDDEPVTAEPAPSRRTRAANNTEDSPEPDNETLTTEPAPSRRTGSGDFDDDEPVTAEPAPSRRTRAANNTEDSPEPDDKPVTAPSRRTRAANNTEDSPEPDDKRLTTPSRRTRAAKSTRDSPEPDDEPVTAEPAPSRRTRAANNTEDSPEPDDTRLTTPSRRARAAKTTQDSREPDDEPVTTEPAPSRRTRAANTTQDSPEPDDKPVTAPSRRTGSGEIVKDSSPDDGEEVVPNIGRGDSRHSPLATETTWSPCGQRFLSERTPDSYG